MAGFIGRCASIFAPHQARQIARTFSTFSEKYPLFAKITNTYQEAVVGSALSGGVAGVFTAVDKGWEILGDEKFCFLEKCFFAPIGIPLSCAIYGAGGAIVGGSAVALFPITLLKMPDLTSRIDRSL